MEAAREGHEDVVQLLVEHGANVNTQTEETQETALTLACCGGFLEVTQFLIEHGGVCVCVVCVCACVHACVCDAVYIRIYTRNKKTLKM